MSLIRIVNDNGADIDPWETQFDWQWLWSFKSADHRREAGLINTLIRLDH